jgi:flavin-dependent dehydrogenase
MAATTVSILSVILIFVVFQRYFTDTALSSGITGEGETMERVYDVIVVGGGIAGVSAAVAASRLGAGVLLVEKGMSFGGVLTGSLVNPMMTFHSHRRQVIGGIGQEIVERLIRERGSHGHLEDPIGFVKSITPFDPEKMKSVLIDLLREAKVDYLFNSLVGRVWVKNGFCNV